MLGRYASTLALYAIDVGCGNLSRQQGVFRIIFEITTTQRITVQVHARTQNDVATVFLGLVTDGLTNLGDQIRIPRRSQAATDGECRSIVGLAVARTGGVDTYTGRTVGQHGGRNAQTWYLGRCTSSTGHEVGLTAYHSRSAEEFVSTTNQ